jgi:hypothetical protein
MSGAGRGPFGEKVFQGALLSCGVLLVVGTLMALLGGRAVASVGTSLLVLGVLGLATGGSGLLVERFVRRRRPPPDAYRWNGQRPRR